MLKSQRVLEKIVYPSIERQAATALKKKLAAEKKAERRKTLAAEAKIAKGYQSRLVTEERQAEIRELFHERKMDPHLLRVILCQPGGAVTVALVTGIDYKVVNGWKRSTGSVSVLKQFAAAIEAYTKNFRLAGKENLNEK